MTETNAVIIRQLVSKNTHLKPFSTTKKKPEFQKKKNKYTKVKF